MALELKGLPQISQDGKLLWFTDKTGEYVVTTNEGGWGAPNFELNQSALLLFIYRMENPKVICLPEGDTVKHGSGLANDDEVVFQANYLNDGSHQFNSVRLMVSADDTQSIDTTPVVFTEGDYWFNSVSLLVKKLVSGQAVVQDLTDTDILDAIAASTSVVSLLCERMYYKNLVVEKNRRYTIGREARRVENTSQLDRMRLDQMDILLGTSTADYQFRYGFKQQAQDTIESLLDDFKLS